MTLSGEAGRLRVVPPGGLARGGSFGWVGKPQAQEIRSLHLCLAVCTDSPDTISKPRAAPCALRPFCRCTANPETRVDSSSTAGVIPVRRFLSHSVAFSVLSLFCLHFQEDLSWYKHVQYTHFVICTIPWLPSLKTLAGKIFKTLNFPLAFL